MTRPGTYQDGDGLFLKVNKSGGAYWLLRLQRDGKRHDIGLGSAKLLSLLEARQKANELRKAVKIDRRDVLAERKSEAAAKVTVREAARQYHMENAAGWKSAIYARQWLASLESHAFPKLGDIATGGIAASDIIDVLLPIWQEIPETARQVRNRICVVLDYAHAKGWRSSEAMRTEAKLRIDAPARADRFVAEWQASAKQLREHKANYDEAGAKRVGAHLNDMAKSLHRDPQLESLLRNRTHELGLKPIENHSVSQALQEYLRPSRSLGMIEATAARGVILPLFATALIADWASAQVCPTRLYHGLSRGMVSAARSGDA